MATPLNSLIIDITIDNNLRLFTTSIESLGMSVTSPSLLQALDDLMDKLETEHDNIQIIDESLLTSDGQNFKATPIDFGR